MRFLRQLGRTCLLVLLVAAGTLALVRYAPGYFSDPREMDAEHAATIRAEIDARRETDSSSRAMAVRIVQGWLHGQLGTSRQYQVPVGELIRPRLGVTARLVAGGLAFGWLAAVALAVPLSMRLNSAGEAAIAAGSALLLAIPVGALATIFLLTNTGGPTLTLGLLLAARDFKFVYRLLRAQWREPHLLFARAQGMTVKQIVYHSLLRPLSPQLASLATMSFVMALSLAVPAEVLFDLPGIGQLAWGAAMNRDLPLLLAVTLLMATAVGLSGLVCPPALTLQEKLEPA
ncbi:MAG TPA: ABC transporter permease subunit [Acidobacteriaceae bacterium]